MHPAQSEATARPGGVFCAHRDILVLSLAHQDASNASPEGEFSKRTEQYQIFRELYGC